MPKGLKPVRRTLATGEVRIYWYHRATGKRLKHDPTSVDGLLEIKRLDERATVVSTISSFPAGTLAALWVEYRGDPTSSNRDIRDGSPEWKRLKPRTKSDYQKVRDWLGKAAEKAVVKSITSEHVIRLRDKAEREHGRRFGNYVLQVVRLVLSWGKLRNWLGDQANPAIDVPQIRKPTGEGNLNRAWTAKEIMAFTDGCPFPLLVMFTLGLYAGMRAGDAIIVTRKAYNGLTLTWVAGKNGEHCKAPVGGAFKHILDEAISRVSDCVQLAQTSRSTAWTADGFRASFFKRVRALEKAGQLEPGCTFHGLRHTIGTYARQGGESSFRIASAIGDRTEAVAEIYGRDADRQQAQIEVLADVQQRFGNIEWKTGLENVPARKPRK